MNRQAAGRYRPDLAFHQIQSSHGLGNRVLDLQTRIDFQKHRTLRRHRKFTYAQSQVFGRLAQRECVVPELGPLPLRQAGGRRFLDDLLVPPLLRAFTVEQVDHVALLIAQNLDFDMSRSVQVALANQAAIPKLGLPLPDGGFNGFAHLGLLAYHAHALAAATCDRLEDVGQGQTLQRRHQAIRIVRRFTQSTSRRDAKLLGQILGLRVVAIAELTSCTVDGNSLTPRTISECADRVVVIDRGRTVFWGTAAECQADPEIARSFLMVTVQE